jgi:signal transduction histidine kinase
MPAARLALWEAVDSPLELVALHFGETAKPALSLEPSQLVQGSRWEESIHPADREGFRAFLDASGPVKPEKFVDYRLIVSDGDLLWVRHWLLHRSVVSETQRRFVGMIMPIPEQKHLEWECLRVSERECNRIGQELHDDLCQVLAGVAFMMHVLGDRAAKIAPEIGTEIHELTAQVQGATDRVRSMAHGLFPAQVNYSSLREALNQLARQTRTRFAVEFVLDLPRKLPPHSPEQIVQVYRIGQEAISNSVRHGSAKTIRLIIGAAGTGLQMSIEDDGKGFPASSARPEGIGMHVMQYRARVLGGSIKFKNLTPTGASVQLTYPASHAPSDRQ